jgi:hypothetical protein
MSSVTSTAQAPHERVARIRAKIARNPGLHISLTGEALNAVASSIAASSGEAPK